jgi:hypothetical protein
MVSLIKHNALLDVILDNNLHGSIHIDSRANIQNAVGFIGVYVFSEVMVWGCFKGLVIRFPILKTHLYTIKIALSLSVISAVSR